MSSAAQQAGSKWRRWLMVAGCLAPVAALTAVFVFKVPLSTVLLVGAFALCPLTHFLLMRGGGHKH